MTSSRPRLSGHDVLIPLPPVSKPSIAGGVKGTVDFSHVTEMGALSISLNGASIASPLVSFDPGALFGGDLFTIAVPRNLDDGPVPAATTLSVAFGGANIPLKDTYYARAATGVRADWSFAGKARPRHLDGRRRRCGQHHRAILPYFQRFDHGVRPVSTSLRSRPSST